MTHNISVVIIAQDEEPTIAQVIASAQSLASEIILVDSGSKDRTVEVARGMGAKIYHQDWLGYAAQKNYAIGLATCEWILSLDADEVLGVALIKEIDQLFSEAKINDYDGFRMPRLLYIGGKVVRHGGFYPDAQLRLFRNGKGYLKPRSVHESITVEGNVGELEHAILHYAYHDIREYARTMDKYARLSAADERAQGYGSWRGSEMNETLHPLWTFAYRYFGRLGFLDGKLGLQMNLIYSNYVRKKIRYLKG